MILRLELQILAAVILDMAFGDPRQFPHPVRGIGRAVQIVERLSRGLFSSQRKAGVFAWFVIVGTTGAISIFGLKLGYFAHPVVGDCLSIFLLYTTIACRDLARHGMFVRDGVVSGPLPEARRRLSLIVSRETGGMERKEIITTAVESIAENISDGVVAPLMFAFIGGPALAMTYKAVSTLDSMVGYKNSRYREFGWFSARMDDLFNFFPARVSAIFLWLSALLLRFDGKSGWKILKRDRKKSSSPNAGWPESVVAGALGLQFGGRVRYFGRETVKPRIGEEKTDPGPDHISAVIGMLGLVLVLTLAAGGAIRFGLGKLLL